MGFNLFAMAIYYLNVKVISRREGRSVVAAAAYRSGERLVETIHSKEAGVTAEIVHDYSKRHNIAYTEILAPSHAASWMRDRQILWDHMEGFEKRKDAQLAREILVALPLEMSQQQGINTVRAFVEEHVVSKGMIADIAIHWEPNNPHAHILCTMRDITIDGKEFGKKNRSWNHKGFLHETRKAWAMSCNEHLLKYGLEGRIDHRSYAVQEIELAAHFSEPMEVFQMEAKGIKTELRAYNDEVILDNIARIDANPNIVLDKLSKEKATFTEKDIASEIFKRVRGDIDHFDRLYHKVLHASDIVRLEHKDVNGETRYTHKAYKEIEDRLFQSVENVSSKCNKVIAEHSRYQLLHDIEKLGLSNEQKQAVEYLIGGGNIRAVVGRAGTGKTRSLQAVVEYYKRGGYRVLGISMAGIASKNLGEEVGIDSRTLASWRTSWELNKDKPSLTDKDVVILDEAGIMDTRDMAYLVEKVKEAGARLLLIGDPDQLQPICAGQAFKGIVDKVGSYELNEVWRQQEDWQKQATELLALGNVVDALSLYHKHDSIHWLQGDNRLALVRDYITDALAHKQSDIIFNTTRDSIRDNQHTSIILAYTRKEVDQLNQLVRDILIQTGQLEEGVIVNTKEVKKRFSAGDKLLFLENEYRAYDVRNGMIGTVTQISEQYLSVLLPDNRTITLDTTIYNHFTHGYATTIHKSQGMTVDRSYVLASQYMDMHATYVALSRHRKEMTLYADSSVFTSLAELYKSLSSSGTIQLLAADFTGKQPKLEIVRAYKQEVLHTVELLKEINDWAEDNEEEIFRHPAWERFQEHVKHRNHIAKTLTRNMKDYWPHIKASRIKPETIRRHANEERYKTDYTPEQLAERELVKQFAAKAKKASSLWKTISDDKGMHIEANTPKERIVAFEAVCSERNRLADSIAQKRVRNNRLYSNWLHYYGSTMEAVYCCAREYGRQAELTKEDYQQFYAKFSHESKDFDLETLKGHNLRDNAYEAFEEITVMREERENLTLWLENHDKRLSETKEALKHEEWLEQTNKNYTSSKVEALTSEIKVMESSPTRQKKEQQVSDLEKSLGRFVHTFDVKELGKMLEQRSEIDKKLLHTARGQDTSTKQEIVVQSSSTDDERSYSLDEITNSDNFVERMSPLVEDTIKLEQELDYIQKERREELRCLSSIEEFKSDLDLIKHHQKRLEMRFIKAMADAIGKDSPIEDILGQKDYHTLSEYIDAIEADKLEKTSLKGTKLLGIKNQKREVAEFALSRAKESLEQIATLDAKLVKKEEDKKQSMIKHKELQQKNSQLAKREVALGKQIGQNKDILEQITTTLPDNVLESGKSEKLLSKLEDIGIELGSGRFRV